MFVDIQMLHVFACIWVSKWCLALTSMSLSDLFFFSAMRGGFGNNWFSRGSVLTSRQIQCRSSLTLGTCMFVI